MPVGGDVGGWGACVYVCEKLNVIWSLRTVLSLSLSLLFSSSSFGRVREGGGSADVVLSKN